MISKADQQLAFEKVYQGLNEVQKIERGAKKGSGYH
jgi:hypothetical protein